jgi:hypothetical protein
VITELTGQPMHPSSGGELRCSCPFHDDNHPSLRINVEKGVWHCDPCGIGGDVFEFVQRVRSCSFREGLAFLAERSGMGTIDGDGRQIVATYNYVDEAGRLRYQTVRFAPKDFRQRRPDDHNGWIWDLRSVQPLLYRLPELQGRNVIVVVEGEKDVDRAWSMGIPATCNHGGAKKWKATHAEQLVAARVRHVIVVADNDEPGQKHALIVAASCRNAGLTVQVIQLPGLPPKGDLSDWLDAAHTAQDLVALAKQVPPSVPPSPASTQTLVPAAESARSEPINLADLLLAIVTFIRRYVVMTDHQAFVAALWVAHTYVSAAFDVTPYLNIQSATPRAGKTRLMEVLRLIVFNAWFTARTSAAALVRKIDMAAPTLLFDERDATFRGDPELAQTLRGLLNAGYKRGGAVSLCVGVGAAIDVKDFNAFCPKALGGLGNLPDTVGDRSIDIILRRRIKSTEPVEKFRARTAEGQAAVLTRQLAAWALAATTLLRDASPVEIDLNNDRAEEVWEPLLQVAALAGPEYLERARSAAFALSGTDATDDDAIGIELLRDIREIFRRTGDPPALATKYLRNELVALEERPWANFGRAEKPITPHRLTRLLADFEVVAGGPMWLAGKTVRGFRRDAFLDAWERYCGPEVLGRKAINEHGPDLENSESLGSPDLTNPKPARKLRHSGRPNDLTVPRPAETGGPPNAHQAGPEAADRERFEL